MSFYSHQTLLQQLRLAHLLWDNINILGYTCILYIFDSVVICRITVLMCAAAFDRAKLKRTQKLAFYTRYGHYCMIYCTLLLQNYEYRPFFISVYTHHQKVSVIDLCMILTFWILYSNHFCPILIIHIKTCVFVCQYICFFLLLYGDGQFYPGLLYFTVNFTGYSGIEQSRVFANPLVPCY